MSTAKNAWLEKILYISFILYAVAIFFGISFHEPWRDEAQSWLVVKNLDLAGIFKKLPSEGHPPTWYLILYPFAKTGLPYAVQNWLSGIIMITAVYILLFKTSLHITIKFLLPFSFFFLYEYSIIARNYCVATLFTALLIYLHPKRFDKPWLYAICVAALFNAHMLAFTFCAAIVAVYTLDAFLQRKLNTNIIACIAFMAISGLYLIPYIVFSDVNNVFEPYVMDHEEHFMQTITHGLLASREITDMALLLFVAVCISFIGNYRILLILLGGASGVIYILSYKFPGDIRHAGIIFLILLFAYGVSSLYAAEQKKEYKVFNIISKYNPWLMAIIIALQIPVAFEYYYRDKEEVFSDSRNAAEFLKANNMDDVILTGHFAWAASALLPYFEDGKTIYYVECDRQGSYYVFDSCFVNQEWAKSPNEYVDIIRKRYSNELDKVVMIFNYPLPIDISGSMDNIYRSPEQTIRDDEMYYMYKFRLSLNSQQ